jgi:hypothetical protein
LALRDVLYPSISASDGKLTVTYHQHLTKEPAIPTVQVRTYAIADGQLLPSWRDEDSHGQVSHGPFVAADSARSHAEYGHPLLSISSTLVEGHNSHGSRALLDPLTRNACTSSTDTRILYVTGSVWWGEHSPAEGLPGTNCLHVLRCTEDHAVAISRVMIGDLAPRSLGLGSICAGNGRLFVAAPDDTSTDVPNLTVGCSLGLTRCARHSAVAVMLQLRVQRGRRSLKSSQCGSVTTSAQQRLHTLVDARFRQQRPVAAADVLSEVSAIHDGMTGDAAPAPSSRIYVFREAPPPPSPSWCGSFKTLVEAADAEVEAPLADSLATPMGTSAIAKETADLAGAEALASTGPPEAAVAVPVPGPAPVDDDAASETSSLDSATYELALE